MSAPKITVHWLDNSRSQRILWLLEELELEYEVKKYARDSKTLLAPAELKKIHPLGKSPVVTIEEPTGSTTTLAESGAITEYLVERFGAAKFGVSPTESGKDRADYLYWLHFAEGSVMGPLILSMVFTKMPQQAPWFLKPIISGIASQVLKGFVVPQVKAHYKFIDDALAGKDFLVGGRLTGADTMISFPVEALEPGLGEGAINDYPNIKRWWDGLKAREAYKKAAERGAEVDMNVFLK